MKRFIVLRLSTSSQEARLYEYYKQPYPIKLYHVLDINSDPDFFDSILPYEVEIILETDNEQEAKGKAEKTNKILKLLQ